MAFRSWATGCVWNWINQSVCDNSIGFTFNIPSKGPLTQPPIHAAILFIYAHTSAQDNISRQYQSAGRRSTAAHLLRNWGEGWVIWINKKSMIHKYLLFLWAHKAVTTWLMSSGMWVWWQKNYDVELSINFHLEALRKGKSTLTRRRHCIQSFNFKVFLFLQFKGWPLVVQTPQGRKSHSR